MAKTELLFHSFPFLEQNLKAEFFESIPQSPGIYRFFDEEGELIYVGKSKNLRKRLFTYKRIRAGKASRKVSKLLSKIASIEFDETTSEQEAFLSENLLIRKHRPEFNHANKAIETYYYILTGRSEKSFQFRLTMNTDAAIRRTNNQSLFKNIDAPGQLIETNIYGCFKGHNPVRRSLGALLQLLWLTENKPADPHQLPVLLTRNLTPLNYSMRLKYDSVLIQSEIHKFINDWFSGRSDQLFNLLHELLGPVTGKNKFMAQFMADRMETLQTFYIKTLHRHYLIRKKFLHPNRFIIYQHELDDLAVKYLHQSEE